MTELLIPAHAERVVCDYLRDRLVPASADMVATKRPSPLQDRMVIVQQTGGSDRDMVTTSPTLLVECWCLTDVASHDLAAMCHALLMRAGRDGLTLGDTHVRRAAFGGLPVNLPDLETRHPRYQFTCHLDLAVKITSV